MAPISESQEPEHRKFLGHEDERPGDGRVQRLLLQLLCDRGIVHALHQGCALVGLEPGEGLAVGLRRQGVAGGKSLRGSAPGPLGAYTFSSTTSMNPGTPTTFPRG